MDLKALSPDFITAILVFKVFERCCLTSMCLFHSFIFKFQNVSYLFFGCLSPLYGALRA